jgi:hypothetical protein
MMANYDLDSIARNELEPGESLLWSGSPDPRRSMLMSLPILLFAIPWTAFAIFWVASAVGMSRSGPNPGGGFSFFPLFGIPFVLIGLAMLSGPFWAYRKAQQTVYAVSNKRAIIIVGGMTRNVQSFYPKKLGNIERTEKADGTGSIIFARRTNNSYNSNTNQSQTSSTAIGFIGIQDVRTVERLILQISESPE